MNDPLKRHPTGTLPSRRSIRLRGYDYSQAGAYFVTLCTHNREFLFGEITTDGDMRLNEFGQIVQEEWLQSPKIRKEIELDEWIIMPNHVHGIVVIANDVATVGAQGLAPLHRPPLVTTTGAHRRAPLRRKPRSLGSFVAGFKSSVTTRINQIRDTAGAHVWQRNYYEHIVRNGRELDAIRCYIANNPVNWSADMDNLDNAMRRPLPQTVGDYLRDVGIKM